MVGELSNFILDLSDEECPGKALHEAAYKGDLDGLKQLFLQDPDLKTQINSGIRPFGATPLRLAATGADGVTLLTH